MMIHCNILHYIKWFVKGFITIFSINGIFSDLLTIHIRGGPAVTLRFFILQRPLSGHARTSADNLAPVH